MPSLPSTIPVTTKVKIDITIPISNAKLLSKNNGIQSQDIIPTKNIGNTTYIYKAVIKSPSKKFKKFFIFNSSFILFYNNNIKDILSSLSVFSIFFLKIL